MINKILMPLKVFVRRYKLLFILIKPFSNIYRIILDKRYFYHYLQGLITNVDIRKKLAKLEANFYKTQKRTSIKTNFIRENSYIENPLTIHEEKVKEIMESLEEYKCQDQLDDTVKFDINSRPETCKLAFYDGIDLFQSEPILEMAVNDSLIEIFNDLYGCDPIIDHIAAWWTFPSEHEHDTQYWHRDIDTLNILKFLVYLTDVDMDSGPHFLIPGSHNFQIKTAKYKKHSDQDKEFETMINQRGTKAFVGSAGTNFLENTFAFHKGTNPKQNPRLLLEIIYSRVPTPFTTKKPFLSLDDSSLSSIIKENMNLFKGKVIT